MQKTGTQNGGGIFLCAINPLFFNCFNITPISVCNTFLATALFHDTCSLWKVQSFQPITAGEVITAEEEDKL